MSRRRIPGVSRRRSCSRGRLAAGSVAACGDGDRSGHRAQPTFSKNGVLIGSVASISPMYWLANWLSNWPIVTDFWLRRLIGEYIRFSSIWSIYGFCFARSRPEQVPVAKWADGQRSLTPASLPKTTKSSAALCSKFSKIRTCCLLPSIRLPTPWSFPPSSPAPDKEPSHVSQALITFGSASAQVCSLLPQVKVVAAHVRRLRRNERGGIRVRLS